MRSNEKKATADKDEGEEHYEEECKDNMTRERWD
jgi:hypothetical protein